MQALKTIQTLSKIGKILSKILFVFCVIGFCGCIVGLIGLALGAQTWELGGLTLHSILQKEAGVTEGTLYASMAAGAIFCAGEAVLTKFAAHYFERELQDGTPFTRGGAKELLRLGILAICIPLGTQILAEIVRGALSHAMTGVEPLRMDSFGSVSTGVAMLILSVVCQYGAELTEKKDTLCL